MLLAAAVAVADVSIGSVLHVFCFDTTNAYVLRGNVDMLLNCKLLDYGLRLEFYEWIQRFLNWNDSPRFGNVNIVFHVQPVAMSYGFSGIL